jgi:DTW domain-containing protein YfiP
MVETNCTTCLKPPSVCVCALATPCRVRHQVVVLQHPQEQDVLLGTAPLLQTCLASCSIHTGLSWPSLKHLLQKDAQPSDWLVLYPASLPRPLTDEEKAAPCSVLTPKGALLPTTRKHKGILVLDGTWSQAKALWWRNPWLLKCHRAVLNKTPPSIYGRLRKEPKQHYVSTAESVAYLLTALGEDVSTQQHVLKMFRTMVQRIRDNA